MIRRRRFRRHRPRGRERIKEASLATIEAVISNMEPVRREVLLLHHFERLSYAAIGQRLSLSRAEVKTHIAEAVAELAGALAGLEDRLKRQPANVRHQVEPAMVAPR